MRKILIFIVMLYIPISFSNALTEYDKGVCKKINADGHLWLDCCPGFIQNKHRCDDCPIGTTGEQCQVDCPNNYYGLRCHGKCDCGLNETCDKTKGCTEFTGFGSTVTTKTQINDRIGIFSTTLAFLAVVVVLHLLIVFFILWKRHKNNTASIEREPLQIRTGNYHMQDDNDETLYSEIRDSMVFRPVNKVLTHVQLEQCLENMSIETKSDKDDIIVLSGHHSRHSDIEYWQLDDIERTSMSKRDQYTLLDQRKENSEHFQSKEGDDVNADFTLKDFSSCTDIELEEHLYKDTTSEKFPNNTNGLYYDHSYNDISHDYTDMKLREPYEENHGNIDSMSEKAPAFILKDPDKEYAVIIREDQKYNEKRNNTCD